jgi:methyl-accepting chemotaxis protein
MPQFSMSQKISFGFGVVILLLIVVGGIGFFELQNASDGFIQYREMAAHNNLTGRLQANMLMMEEHAKDFQISGEKHFLDEYDARFKKMEAFLTEAKKEIQTPDEAERIKFIEKSYTEYDRGFRKAVEYINRRNQNLNSILSVKGPFMEKTLTKIMESAYNDGNTDVGYYNRSGHEKPSSLTPVYCKIS